MVDIEVKAGTQLSLTANTPVAEGQNDIANITITDPPVWNFRVVLDWGDGTHQSYDMPGGATSLIANHTYLDDDPSGTSFDSYAVTARLAGGFARRIGGRTGFDDATALALTTDASGNLYISGSFSGTVDFDPGPGTNTLITSFADDDVFVSKLDGAGNMVWARSMGSQGFGSEDVGRGIAIDAVGNVLVTGSYTGTADFDPGPGILTLTNAGNDDIFVAKLSPTGSIAWARSFGSGDWDKGYGVAVDGAGNAYVTGTFYGTVDFDSGPATNSLTSALYNDVFVIKLDPSGNLLWAKRLGGNGGDTGLPIAIDGAGNVLVAGYFSGTADFDPGVGVFNLTSAGNDDIFVCKLDSGGNFIWAKRMGSTGQDRATQIVFDVAGNVYTVGYFSGTVDFDPGAGAFNLTSAGAWDVFIVKLDGMGTFQWARSFGSTGNDVGNGISVSPFGQVHVVGSFTGTVDFDPGPAVFTLSASGTDGFISTFASDGTFVWAKSFGGPQSDSANAVAVDSLGGIYSAGGFQQTADFDPGTQTAILTSSGYRDGFLARFYPPVVQASNNVRVLNVAPTINIPPNFTVKEGETLVISGSFADPSPKDRLVVNIDFGDGSPLPKASVDATNRLFSCRHIYSATGPFTATVSISDDDGGTSSKTVQVDVSPRPKLQLTRTFTPWANDSVNLSCTVINPPASNFWVRVEWGDHSQDDLNLAPGTQSFSLSHTYPQGPGTNSVPIQFPITAAFLERDRTPKLAASAFALVNDTRIHSYSLALDQGGNIYVTGHFGGTTDFDPGVGQVLYTSANDNDLFVAKYDNAGNLVWAKHMGTGFDGAAFGYSIAVDATGQVYVTGKFIETVDFDPGTNVFNLTSLDHSDCFLLKLDSEGNFAWAKSWGTSDAYFLDNEAGWSVAVDSAGNSYVVSQIAGICDLDPGPGQFMVQPPISPLGILTYFVSKFDSNGNFVWARSIGQSYSIQPLSLVVDSSQALIIAGRYGFGGPPVIARMTKLNQSGDPVWSKAFEVYGDDNSVASATALALDASGAVYVTGYFHGHGVYDGGIDLDPGPAQFLMKDSGGYDGFLVKLDYNGEFLWGKTFGGAGMTNNTQYGYTAPASICVDSNSNIQLCGVFDAISTFAPGEWAVTLTNTGPLGSYDIFVAEFNAFGDFKYAKKMGGSGTEETKSVQINSQGDIYTTGNFLYWGDFDPGDGTLFLTNVFGQAAFVSRLAPQSEMAVIEPPSVYLYHASLVSEDLLPANGLVDPGETVTISLTLKNGGSANTTNLSATLLSTGGVRFPSGPQNYGVLIGGGPAIARPFTFVAATSCGGTITATLALQDGTNDLGLAVFTIPVGVLLTSKSNYSTTQAIGFPSFGTAVPYPSAIVSQGMDGMISKVAVTLTNVWHQWPNLVDVLLVGPSNKTVKLMSGAGGSSFYSLTGQTIVFDDAATVSVPQSSQITSGTYRPTSYNNNSLPAPAPSGPYGTNLAVFSGISPNGTWQLFVRNGGFSGAISNGWRLDITTTNFSCYAGVAVPPALRITQQQGRLFSLTWPAEAQGFQVEIAESLSSPIQWSAVPNQSILSNGQFWVTLPVATTNAFYRLIKTVGN